jgi:hypothetical protein
VAKLSTRSLATSEPWPSPLVYEQSQGVGFQFEDYLQFHAPVLVELLMDDDLHNGSAKTSTPLATINICAICPSAICVSVL